MFQQHIYIKINWKYLLSYISHLIRFCAIYSFIDFLKNILNNKNIEKSILRVRISDESTIFIDHSQHCEIFMIVSRFGFMKSINWNMSISIMMICISIFTWRNVNVLLQSIEDSYPLINIQNVLSFYIVKYTKKKYTASRIFYILALFIVWN